MGSQSINRKNQVYVGQMGLIRYSRFSRIQFSPGMVPCLAFIAFIFFANCDDMYNRLNGEDCNLTCTACCAGCIPLDPIEPGEIPSDIISDITGITSFNFQNYKTIPIEIGIVFFMGGQALAPGDRCIISFIDNNDLTLFQGSTSSDGSIIDRIQIDASLDEMMFVVNCANGSSNSYLISNVHELIKLNRVIYFWANSNLSRCSDLDMDGICDGFDDFPLDPTLSFEDRYPATGEYAVAFEDLYPNIGDYDMNDMILNYHLYQKRDPLNRVISISGQAKLVARGAGYDHSVHLALQVNPTYTGHISGNASYTGPSGVTLPTVTTTASNRIELELFTSSKQTFSDGGFKPNNVKTTLPATISGKSDFEIIFEPPAISDEIESMPLDPYILVKNSGFDIHLIGKAARSGSINPTDDFMDSNGAPWALLIPSFWRHPQEGISNRDAYPHYDEWVSSGGQTARDWYIYFLADKVY